MKISPEHEELMTNLINKMIDDQLKMIEFFKFLADHHVWESETHETLKKLNITTWALVYEMRQGLVLMEEYIAPLQKQARELKKENELLRQRLTEERSFKNIFLDLFKK